MRMWSVSPVLLDSKGLVACWRESLLALNVLQGKTRGYKNHPQLDRFKKSADPIQYICNYLHSLCDEADSRGYDFNRSKIPCSKMSVKRLPITKGQLQYEFTFLKEKVLNRRGSWKYGEYFDCGDINDTFYSIDGDVEYWEKIKF